MKRNKLRTFLCLLLAAAVLTAFAYLAGGAGSQGDPLVTLSYLNDTFVDQVLDKVSAALETRNAALKEEVSGQIAQAEQALRGQLGSSSGGVQAGPALSYAAVTLSGGQTLWGEAGCEVLLRSGEAACVSPGSSTPGLVDTTSGGSVGGGGALQANHLYLMPEARGVTASGEATLLVRGSYTVG